MIVFTHNFKSFRCAMILTDITHFCAVSTVFCKIKNVIKTICNDTCLKLNQGYVLP